MTLIRTPIHVAGMAQFWIGRCVELENRPGDEAGTEVLGCAHTCTHLHGLVGVTCKIPVSHRCRISYFGVIKNTGSLLSGVWKEVKVKTNATDHTWQPQTVLQAEVR